MQVRHPTGHSPPCGFDPRLGGPTLSRGSSPHQWVLSWSAPKVLVTSLVHSLICCLQSSLFFSCFCFGPCVFNNSFFNDLFIVPPTAEKKHAGFAFSHRHGVPSPSGAGSDPRPRTAWRLLPTPRRGPGRPPPRPTPPPAAPSSPSAPPTAQRMCAFVVSLCARVCARVCGVWVSMLGRACRPAHR